MNSFTAGFAMRWKRPDTFLISQLPRRSSDSQPYTAGTSGHLSMPRMTISSIARVENCARFQYSGSLARRKLCYAFLEGRGSAESKTTSRSSAGGMKHQSILEYAHFRWFKVAFALSALAGFAYGFHDPSTKPYGGTALGYTLGAVAALLVLWLLAFGVRKRLYRSTAGSVQGWLSAHVYLGTALLVIATLHTGFELG